MSGDYDNFREVYEMKKSQQEAAYNRQQKEIAELKDFISRNKARVATRNMAMSRQKKLDNMELIEKTTEKPKPEFEFQTARTPGRYIFKTEKLVIGYDEPLSSPLDLEMERGSRIVLTGANGIGKSTLLKSLLGLIKPLDGKVEQGDYLHIGYFEQETPQDIKTTCIKEIWNEFPSLDQREVRSSTGKMRTDYDAHREQGQSPLRRRTGQGETLQAHQQTIQCTGAGRADEPPGHRCKG